MRFFQPGNRDDEQMAVRHVDASGGDTAEKQHEENRMRNVHVGTRGSEAASEEQLDMLRKTVRFEQEAPSASSSSGGLAGTTHVFLEYPASGETQDRQGYLCRSQVMMMATYKFSAVDAFYEMDGRQSRYIREVLDGYRGEDAGDLKRSELNKLVDNMTCLTLSRKKCGQSIRRS